MGLDLTLGGLILLMGVRGWIRGFTVQAIRLAGLVAAAYAAVPARDQIKPHALAYLPSIHPDLIDRLLWWSCAVVCYFVIVGVGSLAVAVSRRQPHGLEEANRSDQFAGLGLGVLKGVLVAAFLLSAAQRHATPLIEKVSWVGDQAKESVAWEWSARYQPAEKVWTSPPVQQFVAHVKKMGLNPPEGSKAGGRDELVPEAEAEPTVKTASRLPQMSLPADPAGAPDDSWGFGGLTDAFRSLWSSNSP